MYHAVHKRLFREYTIEDIAVPYAAAKQVIDHLDDSFCKYPLWLCPERQTTAHARGLIARQRMGFEAEYTPDMMISVGVWAAQIEGSRFLVLVAFNSIIICRHRPSRDGFYGLLALPVACFAV